MGLEDEARKAADAAQAERERQRQEHSRDEQDRRTAEEESYKDNVRNSVKAWARSALQAEAEVIEVDYHPATIRVIQHPERPTETERIYAFATGTFTCDRIALEFTFRGADSLVVKRPGGHLPVTSRETLGYALIAEDKRQADEPARRAKEQAAAAAHQQAERRAGRRATALHVLGIGCVVWIVVGLVVVGIMALIQGP